jgi:diguanylate cyclase (GGDEF)-like protein
MHRVIQEPLQLLLLGASEAEESTLRSLLRDQPQLALARCDDATDQLPALLAALYPDLLLICADRRGSPPSSALPCLWLLRQPPSQPAADELPLRGLGTARLLRLLALLIDQQRAAERLSQLAQRDPLTGLAAPVQLHERLARRLLQAQRHGELCALVHIALDRMPSPFDRADHAGERDELLAQIGAAIADRLDERQLAVRLGEGEFLIATAGLRSQREVAALACELLRGCRLRGERQRHEWRVTASAGIAVAPFDGETVDELLLQAREASRRCRAQGGDNFLFANDERNQLAHELTQLQDEFGHALLRNEIALRYQPQLDLHRRRVTAIEVLLRWQHPRLGLLAPRYFLDIARRSGTIHPLGSWALRKACEQRRQWRVQGLAPVTLTFNIERRQLQQGLFCDSLLQLVDEGVVTDGGIGIEIDEAELAQCNRDQLGQLAALSERGVEVAVDRFSGSHCRVAQLQQLPLRALKIERELTVRETDFDAALRLCRALRCDAVAAGIEQRRTAAWLQDRDCDAIQGFVVSRPLTADELPQRLKRSGQV